MERLTPSSAPHRRAPSGSPAASAERARRRRSQRGFTLIELTVVVVLVSIFAIMAIPQVTIQLQHRHTQEAAQRIAIVYQQARVRAMGQGGAIMVRYNVGTNSQGSLDTREALIGNLDTLNSCALIPSTSCTQTNWELAADGQSRQIEVFDLGSDWGLANVYSTLTPEGSASGNPSMMDVCFTPLGRAYVRYMGTAGTWNPMRGVPVINVFRGTSASASDGGLVRRVLVLPTGIARLQL